MKKSMMPPGCDDFLVIQGVIVGHGIFQGEARIGFVARRWPQCSAGKSRNAGNSSASSVFFTTASGYLAP